MVFVLDRHKKPLMPWCKKRARLLLERGRARVHKMAPFTIRLVDGVQEDSVRQDSRLKLDPGSKTTGVAARVGQITQKHADHERGAGGFCLGLNAEVSAANR